MVRTAATTATEVLGGLVDRVTFHNPENGFCVLRVKARGQRDLITLVGHAAMISAGEFVQASGAWMNDRTHGLQFKAAFLKATAPTTVEGIEKYLGSGMIRGPDARYQTLHKGHLMFVRPEEGRFVTADLIRALMQWHRARTARPNPPPQGGRL